MSDLHRLNIEIIDGQVCICFDLHEKGQPCEYEPQSPEQIVKLLKSAGRQIFQLKQRNEQLEKSNTHEALRVMLQKANAKIEQLERDQAQRDIEQQIKALKDLRESVQLEWWSDDKVLERIEKLRAKGGGE